MTVKFSQRAETGHKLKKNCSSPAITFFKGPVCWIFLFYCQKSKMDMHFFFNSVLTCNAISVAVFPLFYYDIYVNIDVGPLFGYQCSLFKLK